MARVQGESGDDGPGRAGAGDRPRHVDRGILRGGRRLFRELPVRDPSRLVRRFAKPTRASADLDGVSLPLHRTYREGMRSLTDIALWREGVRVNLSVGDELPEAVSATLVSGNFFTLLGLDPARGRLLTRADDEREGEHPVAVLSEAAWRRRFAASDDVTGTIVRVNGHPFQVVGVAPRGFHGIGLQSLPTCSCRSR